MPETTIDEGEYIHDDSSYASTLISSNSADAIFINFKSSSFSNGIAFYDTNREYLLSKSLYYNNIIYIPDGAAYFATYFSTTDDNFVSKKDTPFIYQVNVIKPHYKELSKKYAKESGQEFFRESLDGKINLFGKDYEIIANSNLEDQLLFLIEKYSNISNSWLEYYKGEFNKTDCKLDYSRNKCELKTTAIDEYNNVMDKYENTYDLIKLAPEITKINLHKRSLMQVYIRGANSITNLFGGIYWEDDTNEAIDSHEALVNTYHFAYIKTANEFTIKDSSLSEINGVYAGINGGWYNWNGFTAYALQNDNTTGWLRIKRNSDGKDLYTSALINIVFSLGNIHIPLQNDIPLIAISNNGVVSGSCKVYNLFAYRIYQRLLCDVDSVEDPEGVKNTYDLLPDDFAVNSRNYKKCIGLEGGMFFCTSRTVDEPTKYGLNDYGKYFTNQFIPAETGLGRALPISKNSWANASIWYVYDDFTYSTLEARLRKQYTLKDSYSIAAVIKAILKKIDPTLKHEATAEYSKFLYDSTTPMGYNRFYVYITQKTNILKGEYDQAAQKAEISLKEVADMLRDCFRCYWYIDNGKFKIEHIRFFMNGGSYLYNSNTQLDLTTLKDQFNKKYISYFQSEIEYDKSDLNQRYEFSWADNVTDLFDGISIDVESNYIQKDKNKEISIAKFVSDVDYMLFDPSNFSNDGFALLCPISKKIAPKLVNSGYYSAAGVLINTTNAKNTELISLDGFVKLEYSTYIGSSGLAVSFWDENRNIITDLSIAGIAPNINSGIINLASQEYINAKFVAISYYSASATYPNYKCILSNELALELPIVETQLIDENGDEYNAIIQNWYASWAYLINFYMYDMPASNIVCNILNNIHVNFIKTCMKHTVEFISEEDLNELQLIKTRIGNGKIDEFSIDLNSRAAKVKLSYEPK